MVDRIKNTAVGRLSVPRGSRSGASEQADLSPIDASVEAIAVVFQFMDQSSPDGASLRRRESCGVTKLGSGSDPFEVADVRLIEPCARWGATLRMT